MPRNSEAVFDRLEVVTLALMESLQQGGTDETPLLIQERDDLLSQLATLVDSPFFSARMARVRADDAALVRAAHAAYGDMQAELTQGHKNRRSAKQYLASADMSTLDSAG